MRKSSLWAVAALSLTLALTGCKKEAAVDSSKYVELGQYKGVEVTLISADVTENDIASTIDGTLQAKATYEKVDRAAVAGDLINIDVTGSVDGKINDGFTSNGFDLYSGYDNYIMAGFEQNLYGLKAGAETVFDVVVPEGFSTASLIGKTVTFTVKVNSVSSLKTPELTEENVKELTGYASIDEYKAALEEQLAVTKAAAVETTKRSDAWKAATDNATVLSYPEGSVEEKMTSVENQFAVYAQLNNQTVDEYLQAQIGTTLQEYAENMVKQELVLAAIEAEENIKLTSAEYDEKLPEYATRYKYDSVEEFETKFGKETIEKSMLWEKIQQFVADQAVVVE
ncbi:MAG: trigger factor [Lachnospiraceae bacterium]|nr:trigger factor [Lachnospiraceae bacterium]